MYSSCAAIIKRSETGQSTIKVAHNHPADDVLNIVSVLHSFLILLKAGTEKVEQRFKARSQPKTSSKDSQRQRIYRAREQNQLISSCWISLSQYFKERWLLCQVQLRVPAVCKVEFIDGKRFLLKELSCYGQDDYTILRISTRWPTCFAIFNEATALFPGTKLFSLSQCLVLPWTSINLSWCLCLSGFLGGKCSFSLSRDYNCRLAPACSDLYHLLARKLFEKRPKIE